MENDKRYKSVGDENIKQVTKRLRQRIAECLEKDEPIIASVKNENYILGHFKNPEELIKFAAKTIKSIASITEKATGLISAEELLGVVREAIKEIKEEKASEQKTDAQEQKTLHQVRF